MKVGLCDVDGHNFPNLPLMKLSAYHKKQGDKVEWWVPMDKYDIVYQSKVFTFTPDIPCVPKAESVVKGGTGYKITAVLPDEIEHIMPDYSIYPKFSEAYGFLTRGCPRGCPFCIVGKKEGYISTQVADLRDFRHKQKAIKLLDPNLLACQNHERLLHQLIESKAQVDFTQGLDIRLVNRDNSELLSKVRVKNIHFAWDNPKEDLTRYFQGFKALSGLDKRKLGVYVLTNFHSTIEEDLYRIYTLRELGYSPYVMVFDKDSAPDIQKRLQRWVNNRIIFNSCKRFEEFNSFAPESGCYPNQTTLF